MSIPHEAAWSELSSGVHAPAHTETMLELGIFGEKYDLVPGGQPALFADNYQPV
jgi:hypothetical protein